jgi:RNA polymerase sigma-70 factor (ECF subfamily)
MSSPPTRPSLLIRIADRQDAEAWSEFVEIYEPILIRVAKSKGLQPNDASELAQEVLITVMNSISRFEFSPRAGSFRRWLATITCNKIRDHFRSLHRNWNAKLGLRLDLESLEEEPLKGIDESLELQWRHQMFARASEAIRGTVQHETWMAFWRTSIDMMPAEQVAKELNLSLGNVYVARSRVIAKLRKWVRQNSDDAQEFLS